MPAIVGYPTGAATWPRLDVTAPLSPESAVKIFAFFIEDDRYSVPTLVTEECADDAAAMDHARTLLRASPHHRAVDVWDDERMVGRLQADLEGG